MDAGSIAGKNDGTDRLCEGIDRRGRASPRSPTSPPEDDSELRALIDEQYQDYIDGTEDDLNCLNDEAVRTRAAYHSVFERSIQYFGIEAGVEFDTAD